jgi:hypothetical protein
MDWRMHRPELTRDPLMKEFVEGQLRQAIARTELQHHLDLAMGAR